MNLIHKFSVDLLDKSQKKQLYRFYKLHRISAKLKGYDKVYVITNDDEIIAAVILSRTMLENKQYLLHAMQVDKAYQQQGIGLFLLDFVCKIHSNIVLFCAQNLVPFYHKAQFTFCDHSMLSSVNLKSYLRYKQTKPELLPLIYAPNTLAMVN